MNVYYHLGKTYVVGDALSRIIMGIIVHVEDGKNKLVKDIPRLARSDLRSVESTSGGV